MVQSCTFHTGVDTPSIAQRIASVALRTISSVRYKFAVEVANWAVFAASADEGTLPADGAASQLIQKTAIEHFAAEIYELFVGGTALQAIYSLIVESAVYHWGLFHADVISCD